MPLKPLSALVPGGLPRLRLHTTLRGRPHANSNETSVQSDSCAEPFFWPPCMPDFRAVLSRSDNVGVTRQSSAMTPKLGSQAKSPGHCIWKPAIGKHWPSFLAHLRRPSWRRDQVSSVRISGAATSGCRFGERAVPALPQVQRVQLTDRTRLGGAVDAGDPHRSCFVPSRTSPAALCLIPLWRRLAAFSHNLVIQLLQPVEFRKPLLQRKAS